MVMVLFKVLSCLETGKIVAVSCKSDCGSRRRIEYMLDYLGFPHGETEVGKFIGTVDRDPDGKTAFASVSCIQRP